jgi:hypothetical protein
MHSCDSEQSSDDSDASDDPHQSSAVPNSLLQLQGDYASGSDDLVPCTPEKEFEEETGSRTALISTRPLSSPSAGVFLQSVQLKIGKFMFLILILMVLIAIFYSILLQPASAVSSARECLGRLSRNGHLMDTIWSCLRRNHDNYDAVFGRGRVKNIYQAQCEFHCRMATEAGKLFIPFNIFA